MTPAELTARLDAVCVARGEAAGALRVTVDPLGDEWIVAIKSNHWRHVEARGASRDAAYSAAWEEFAESLAADVADYRRYAADFTRRAALAQTRLARATAALRAAGEVEGGG